MFDGLWKVKANYMEQDDKHKNLFFCVKMFKATADSLYLETVCPDGDIVFERVINGRSER